MSELVRLSAADNGKPAAAEFLFSADHANLRGNRLFCAQVAGNFKLNHFATLKRFPAIEQSRHMHESIFAVTVLNKTVTAKSRSSM
jgi:hypothetical protein